MSEKTFTGMDRQQQIAEYYSTESEWRRLELDAYHHLEYRMTMRVLERYLPATGRVLDAGGGPGRYTRELCRLGYQVTLLDFSETQLATAQAIMAEEPPTVQAQLCGVMQGDVRDLSAFADDQFDATLCLGGPLSHIFVADERRHALQELIRVTKPGGLVVLGVIGYLAALRTLVWKYGGQHFLNPDYLHTMRTEGNGGSWHFFRAGEMRDLAESCGLQTITMLGCESLSTGMIEETNRLAEDPARWAIWEALLFQHASDPAVVDMSGHILYIGRANAE